MDEKDFKELQRLAAMLQQLSRGEIRPSKIIGTGYKNPRAEAYKYLANRIMDELVMANGDVPEEYNSAYFKELRIAGVS